MDCITYGRATTRQQGVAFAAAIGVAVENEDGRVVPLVEAHITTSDDGWVVGKWVDSGQTDEGGNPVLAFAPTPGWYFNVRYYGAAKEALAQGGNPASADLFARYPGLLAITEARTGEPMEWKALTGDPTPPGYECEAYGVRLYQPSHIATPTNVFT